MICHLRRVHTRWVFLALGLLSLNASLVRADEEDPDAEEPLPLLSEMEIPSMEDLLTRDPVDWVVLKLNPKQGVLITQEIYPRPATLEKKAQELSDLTSSARRPKQQDGESREEYQERIREMIAEAKVIRLSLPPDPDAEEDTSAEEYRLPVSEIETIRYHEDLMIDRVNLLMDAGKLAKAFELLLVVQRRNKQIGREEEWPGYVEANNRLIFEEAQLRVKRGQLEQALAFFEDLWKLDRKYKGLSEGIGGVVDKLISDAHAQNNLRKARFFLLRLNNLDDDHPVVVKWVGDFVARTDKLLDQADEARVAKKYDESYSLVMDATKVWPPHKRLKAAFQRAASRFQVLNVGVLRFSGEKTPFFLPTPADRRHQSLLAANLFEVSRYDRTSYYQSPYFEEWNPTDLGREIVFSLRTRRKNWEPHPTLDAHDLVRSLNDRLVPGSKYYDERLTTFVRSMEIKSPYQFVVNFNTVPVRPQALFRFPIRKATESSPGEDANGDEVDPMADILSQRFRIDRREGDNKIAFRRVIPQPDNLSRYRVAEIVEHKYASADLRLQALLKGDISVLPNPPIWLADQIASDDRFRVETYTIPTTHVLQFNPASKAMQNSQFRRAIANMIDREKILKETILRDPEMNRGRLTSSPFPMSSYATGSIDPRPRDLPLAVSLSAIAKKQFGGEFPELVMVLEPNDAIRLAAVEMQTQLKRIGINIKLVYEPDEETPENWDIVYRTVQLTEPVTQLWPFLTMKQDARVEDLEHLPDWLRQQLIELEQAVDYKTAVAQLHRLHFRLDQLVHIIPLWEIDNVIVFRAGIIQGTPQDLIGPYHDVEKWNVDPWFPTELL